MTSVGKDVAMASRNDSTTIATMSWRSCFRNDLFRGKIALVTGGGSGIGFAIATELASLGATVVIASRKKAKCESAAQTVNALGYSGRIVVGPSTNIRSEDDIRNLVEHIIKTYGALNLLVNNSGGQFIQESAEISRKGFSAVVETNLRGTFLVCREAYNQYMRDHGGSIVNITIGNRNGMPGMMHSAASRAGVENMTASLCQEWIESRVRINCVRPGIIFTESGFENYGPAGDYFLEKIVKSLPARRLGSAEEVSSAVVWLLSEGASYVTGSVVCVDGGGSFVALPLVDIEDAANLPVYGNLSPKAKL
ncbi:short-chain dehydrogenase/reductase SDR [Nitzschia inconspicua]|uniref:Short-chain dehydrogenase/reductase SDR n=1 Tax=Nitzschia inconspicua TaxID=303405 RepID=A0A9K3L0U2_9STRA|nr:short-chain dehydrogenase/reductase SDR [Nitzschia inconspicua]